MMAEFIRIQIVLFLILMLQFTVTGLQFSTVRFGDDVTLLCENVRDDQKNCQKTVWFFHKQGTSETVTLVHDGQIKSKSDRLSLTEKCSLVIKKVTEQDVGRYTCRQSESPGQYEDVQVDLSVVYITEHKDNNQDVWYCLLMTYTDCRDTVKWLFQGKDVDKNNKDMRTSHNSVISIPESQCYATVTFLNSDFISSSMVNLLKCSVTDAGGKQQQFPFRLQSSGDTTTTESTITTTEEETDDEGLTKQALWWIVAPVLGLAAVIIVVFVKKYQSKEKKSKMNKNTGQSLNPAETQSGPETSQDTTDPEGVSYASISYTKKTNSKAQKNDEADAVTYGTVKVSSSSAGASTDPSNLYATINNPN